MAEKYQPEVVACMVVEQIKCLIVGKVSVIGSDPFFQRPGIGAVPKHFFIVIGFQKQCVTLIQMTGYIIAGAANVGENTYMPVFIFNPEGAGFGGIMIFQKGMHRE